MSHDHLSVAKRKKDDEFYTRMDDVVAELVHYTSYFEDKVVCCNADGQSSAFVRHFVKKFHTLQLQGLFCTGIDGESFEYDGNSMTVSKIDGDFRSSDSTRLLEQADIVITNPPFSLFREYMAQLFEYGKDFLVIGNKNAISYKEVFPALQEGRLRLGYTTPNNFDTPTGTANLQGLCRWFTTLPTPDKTFWTPTASVNDREYQSFDLYPAINIDRTSDIPIDYDGLMGVPITALDHLDPEKFEIVDLIARGAVIDHSYDVRGRQLTEINGKPRYSRLIINKLNQINQGNEKNSIQNKHNKSVS